MPLRLVLAEGRQLRLAVGNCAEKELLQNSLIRCILMVTGNGYGDSALDPTRLSGD
jgi:hypothetical protein